MFSFPCIAVEEIKTVDDIKCASSSSLCDDDGRVELFSSSVMIFYDLVFTSIDGNIYIVDELKSDPYGMYTTVNSLRLIYTGYHEDDDDEDDDTEWLTCGDGSRISKRVVSKCPDCGTIKLPKSEVTEGTAEKRYKIPRKLHERDFYSRQRHPQNGPHSYYGLDEHPRFGPRGPNGPNRS
jgi:hypothetical protein